MNLDRRHTRFADDRHNVADQPGGAIFWSGVIVSVILGLLLRGMINPQTVRQQLESAASQIHPTLRVDFENAEVSLAQGWWPRLAIVIQRVRMTSTNTCWMAPRLIADEIRLPISMTSLIMGHSPFRAVEAGDVEVRLTAVRPIACDQGASTVLGPQTKPEKKLAVRIIRDEGGKLTPSSTGSGEVNSLRIRRLVLVSEVYPQGALDLEDFQFTVRSTSPVLFHAKSQLAISRKPGQTDNVLRASLDVEYKEFPERTVDLRLNGRLREGTYTLAGAYAPDRDDLKLSADLRHVPLVELFDLIKGRDPRVQDFRPRLSWLSFRAETAGEAKKLAQLPIELSQIRLEGDLGEIAADRIRLESLNPFRLTPSSLRVEMLDWDRFFQYLGQPHPTPILNKVGRFRGVVDINDEMNFRMRGEHSGLEFIFSNQSRREIQSVNAIQGEIIREKGRWRATVSAASVDQGAFDGHVGLRADPTFQILDVDLNTKTFSLSPRVQTLMTNGGKIASLQSQVRVRFKEGEIESLQGQVKTDEAIVSDVRVSKASFAFTDRGGITEVNPRIESVSVPSTLLQSVGLNSLFPGNWTQANRLNLSMVVGRFQVRRFNDLKWTSVSAKPTQQSGSLTTQGGWDPRGELSGKVTLRNGSSTQHYEIEGTRDLPRIRGVDK